MEYFFILAGELFLYFGDSFFVEGEIIFSCTGGNLFRGGTIF